MYFLSFASIFLIFKNLDMFGKPVHFSYKNKETSKSTIGAVTSVLIFGLFIFLLYLFSKDFFRRENPNTIVSQSFEQDPSSMTIGPDDFAFGFGLQDPTTFDHYKNENIYTVKAYQNIAVKTEQADGSYDTTYSSIELQLETCTEGHFGTAGSNFANLELDQLYCVKAQQTGLDQLAIQGTFESNVYKYFEAEIIVCNNATSGGKCADNATISSKLSGGYFATYFTALAIDPNSYANPNVKYRNSFFTTNPYPYFKRVDQYLQHTNVISDIGWLAASTVSNQYVDYGFTQEMTIFQTYTDSMISFLIRPDQIVNNYSRTYKKIQDVIAQVNGVGSVCLIVAAIILSPYVMMKFNESLINDLFDVINLNGDDDCNNCNPGKGKDAKKKRRGGCFKGKSKPKAVNKNKGDEKKEEIANKSGSMQKKTHDIHIDIGMPINSNSAFLNSSPNQKDVDKQAGKDLPSCSFRFESNVNHAPVDLNPPVLGLFDIYNPPTDSSREGDHSDNENDVPKDKEQSGAGKRHFNKTKSPKSARMILKKQSSKVIPRMLENYEQQTGGEANTAILKSLIANHNNDNSNNTEEKEKIERDISGDIGLRSPQKLPNHQLDQENEENLPSSVLKKEKSVVFSGKLNDEQQVIQGEPCSPVVKEHIRRLGTKLKNCDHKLNITFGEYLTSFFYRSKKLKQKLHLLEAGVARINERLDIFNVFKKFREVDKLKLLLFETEQVVLFDHLPKPELVVDHAKAPEQTSSETKKKHQYFIENKFVKEAQDHQLTLACYDKIKQKDDKTIIDEKFLNIYEELIKD